MKVNARVLLVSFLLFLLALTAVLLAVAVRPATPAMIMTMGEGIAVHARQTRGVSRSDGNPLSSGEKVSLREAEQLVGYEIVRPQDPLASDATLATVWASDKHVAFLYESGIEVTLFGNELKSEAEARAEFEGRAGFVSIEGSPAFVVQTHPLRSPGMVMQIGKSTVQIIGGPFVISRELILRVAASISS